MLILIADDDPVSCRLLEDTLTVWGHEVRIAADGQTAWNTLRQEPAPQLAILDWLMPHLNGVDICRRMQQEQLRQRPYLILLSARDSRADLVAGLNSGADDYIAKPFDADELHARVQAGSRILDLQRGLAERVQQLERALTEIKQLKGLLPICMYCKKIRDDDNYWQQVEAYIVRHSQHVQFSHGICPECYEHIMQPEIDQLADERSKNEN